MLENVFFKMKWKNNDALDYKRLRSKRKMKSQFLQAYCNKNATNYLCMILYSESDWWNANKHWDVQTRISLLIFDTNRQQFTCAHTLNHVIREKNCILMKQDETKIFSMIHQKCSTFKYGIFLENRHTHTWSGSNWCTKPDNPK